MNIRIGDVIEVEHTGGVWRLARVMTIHEHEALFVVYVGEYLEDTAYMTTTYPEFCRSAPPRFRITNAVARRRRVRAKRG